MVRPKVTDHLLGGAPHVELCHPVLYCVDGYDQQDGPSLGTPQEHVHKGDHLDSFAQPHTVGQDTAKAWAVVESAEGLNQIVV